MLSDQWGQGVTYPVLEDKPNVRTLSEGLVNGIVPKTVMTFDSRSQRGATIISPKAGMSTWIRDVKVLEVYDGASWTTVAAGSSAWTQVSLASGWLHDGNDQGNFEYKVVNLFGDMTLMLRGGIKRNGSYPSSLPSYFKLTATALPSTARPVNLRTLPVPCSDVSSNRIGLKLDVRPSSMSEPGHLYLYGIQSDSKPAWVGFNGVFTSL